MSKNTDWNLKYFIESQKMQFQNIPMELNGNSKKWNSTV